MSNLNEAKSRMSSLFSTGPSPSGKGTTEDNASLRYTAPKESSVQQQKKSIPTKPSTASPVVSSTPSAIVHSATITLYQFNASTAKYTPMESSALLGCVLVGSGIEYDLLIYNNQKAHLCKASITAVFQCTLQAKGYVNFYDSSNRNWSMKFKTEIEATSFMKQLALIKVHIGIWNTASPSWVQADQACLNMDISHNSTDGSPKAQVKEGDTVGVLIQVWRIVGTKDSLPSDLVTKVSPFESNNRNQLRKFRVGDHQERFKALELGMVGMKKGSTRMIVSPPKLSKEWLLIEVELVKMKSASGSGGRQPPASNNPNPPQSSKPPPLVLDQQQNTQPIIPYAPFPGSPRAVEYERQQMNRQKEELQYQQQVLEEKRKKFEFESQNASATNSPPYPPSSYDRQRHRDTHTQQYPLYRSSPLAQDNSSPQMMTQMMMELHSKMDQILSQNHHKNSYMNTSMGKSTNVQTLVRGIEKLAFEADQSSSQVLEFEREYQSLNEKLGESVRINQTLELELKRAQDGLRSSQHQVNNQSQEILALTSARDQLDHQLAMAHHEEKVALWTEASDAASSATRILEQSLATEVQARVVAEQQCQVQRQQFDMERQVLASETEARIAHVEAQDKANLELSVERQNRAFQSDLEMYQNQCHASQTMAREALTELEHKTLECHASRQELALEQGKCQALEQQVTELTNKQQQQEQQTITKSSQHQTTQTPSSSEGGETPPGANSNSSENSNLKTAAAMTTATVKEIMNDIYFQCQDCFLVDETNLDNSSSVSFRSTDILSNVRKILKSSTKDALVKLVIQPEPERSDKDETPIEQEQEEGLDSEDDFDDD